MNLRWVNFPAGGVQQDRRQDSPALCLKVTASDSPDGNAGRRGAGAAAGPGPGPRRGWATGTPPVPGQPGLAGGGGGERPARGSGRGGQPAYRASCRDRLPAPGPAPAPLPAPLPGEGGAAAARSGTAAAPGGCPQRWDGGSSGGREAGKGSITPASRGRLWTQGNTEGAPNNPCSMLKRAQCSLRGRELPDQHSDS